MKKKLLIGLIGMAGLTSVVLMAKLFVGLSYSSSDMLMQGKILESDVTPAPVEDTTNESQLMQFNPEKYNMGYDACIGIPNSVYNPMYDETKDEYVNAHSDILCHIKDVAEGNIKSLDYNYQGKSFKEADLTSGGYDRVSWEEFKEAELSVFQPESQGMGEIGAVYFFNNYFVVYEIKLNTEDTCYIVVDYSKTGFGPETECLDKGGILGPVAVYSGNAVYEDYNGQHIVYIPMWSRVYYDRQGNSYTGQNLIDKAGTMIDW